MTAAVYRWLSDFCAFLLDQSGAGLVACWITGVLLLCGLAWAIATAWENAPKWWRDAWSSVARWHARIILKNGPIPFDRRGK